MPACSATFAPPGPSAGASLAAHPAHLCLCGCTEPVPHFTCHYLSSCVLAFSFHPFCTCSGSTHLQQSSPRVSHAPHFCAPIPTPLILRLLPHTLAFFHISLPAAVFMNPRPRPSTSVHPSSIHPSILPTALLQSIQPSMPPSLRPFLGLLPCPLALSLDPYFL